MASMGNLEVSWSPEALAAMRQLSEDIKTLLELLGYQMSNPDA